MRQIFLDKYRNFQVNAMSSRTITLDLPDQLYEQLTTQAQAAARTLSDVVVETLVRNSPPSVEENLSLGLQRELKALEDLSDEALWTIAQSAMNLDKVALYDVLLERQQDGDLTLEGQALLDRLHNEADELMLRKAHAYALLKSRGHVLPTRHR